MTGPYRAAPILLLAEPLDDPWRRPEFIVRARGLTCAR